MTRAVRIEYPGAFYHVMHRGNAGYDIFLSERDQSVDKPTGKNLHYHIGNTMMGG